jgi:DNA (cytosine-5)-methyltransferase 1
MALHAQPLRYGSLFSGIGGFDIGLDRAGMECAWQVEIDDDARSVLVAKWPKATQHVDVREVGAHNLDSVDLICGGFPCQDLSVAGKRAGLDGERSGLWFHFRRVLAELKPSWCLIENVPGLLSGCGCELCHITTFREKRHERMLDIGRARAAIDDPRHARRKPCECVACVAGRRLRKAHSGRNAAIVLQGLVELGYRVAYRVLDSQYFGLAQRRERVFIVGHLGDGRAAEVLFEPESLRRNPAPSREAGARVAASLTSQVATLQDDDAKTT